MGVDAFALKPWFLKPYPKLTAGTNISDISENIRHIRESLQQMYIQRNEDCVECIYILSQHLRIIKNGIQLAPSKARRVVLSCVILHTLMCKYFPDLHDINLDGPEVF